jgi:hypothetical protein
MSQNAIDACTCPRCRKGVIPSNYTFGGYVAADSGWAKVHPIHFARAFESNCTGVRLTKDERNELERLFMECSRDAEKTKGKVR